MLFEILHYDWYQIPPLMIAELCSMVADKKFSDNKTSLRKLLSQKANQPAADLFSAPAPKGMSMVSKAIEKLIADAPNTTLINLVENLIRDAHVLSWIMQSDDKHWHLQVLTGLFEFIKEEARRNPRLNLEQLINIFSLMEKEQLNLPLVQVSGSDKGVNLMTAHGSKGLEFEHVFLQDVILPTGRKKKTGKRL